MNIANIKTAGAKVRAGAWVKDIPVPGFDGVALRVRGLNNPDARRLREKLASEAGKGGPIAGEKLDAIASEVIAEAILLDWNLTDDGAPLPFSKEKAAELLADEDIGPLLREAVSYAASVVGDKGAAELDAAAGN